MPRVGGKEYPYTPAGMAAADYAKKKKRAAAKPRPKRKSLKPRALKGGAYQRAIQKGKPKSRRGR
jgi:hypothetical protein